MRNKNTFDTPLQVGDSETQTVGCRHTNPDICSKHSLPGKCAFISKNNICFTPPTSWSKKFIKLKSQQREEYSHLS